MSDFDYFFIILMNCCWNLLQQSSYNMIRINLVNGDKQKKVLIDLLPQFDANVQQFLQRIIYICGIKNAKAQDLQLYYEDYLLPYGLPSQCISPQNLYTVYFKRDMKCQCFNTAGSVIKDKKQKKLSKRKRKQKSVSSESPLSQSQSSSSSLQDFSKVHKEKEPNKIKNKKPIESTEKKKQPIIQKKIQVPPKVTNVKPTGLVQPALTKKSKFQQVKQSSEESDSSSSQKIKVNKFKKPALPQKIVSQPPKNKLIQDNDSDSDSSSSQKEAKQHKKHKQKVNEILQTINSKTKQPILQKPANIPIAVRNKKIEKKAVPVQSKNVEAPPKPKQDSHPKQALSFKEYKEMKWVSVTKQVLNSWKQKNQGCIIAQNNEIRFKVMQLDEEKFIPVNSGWICGFISQISLDGKEINVKLLNVTKQGRNIGESAQFFNEYEIPFYNMQELQINKNTFIEPQKQTLSIKQSENSKKIQEIQHQTKPQVPKFVQPKIVNTEIEKPAQSIEDFICGQIHYYFGQKNYPTDLFMQMHANKDEKKYIDFKLMLNFPKIKKVLKDEEKLWNYLINDDKYSSRYYELDFERRMIRRKGLS